jgi:hypothetical protein
LTIIWGVRPIVVDSVECVARRARPHVTEKCREIVTPLTTHCDTSAAVVLEANSPRVVAPRLRRVPRFVFARAWAPAGISVTVARQSAMTPTTNRRALSQTRRQDRSFDPALASADPPCFVERFSRVAVAKDGERSEALAGQVQSRGEHARIISWSGGYGYAVGIVGFILTLITLGMLVLRGVGQ